MFPSPKKFLSPGSRAKADKRNARGKAKRADIAAAASGGGGAKSAKKWKATTDEEMPVSGGGSSSSASNTQNRFHVLLLLDAQKNATRLEAQELALADEAAAFALQTTNKGP
jgi:hypothetical protein